MGILRTINRRIHRREILRDASTEYLLTTYVMGLEAGFERCERADVPLSERQKEVLLGVAKPKLEELADSRWIAAR